MSVKAFIRRNRREIDQTIRAQCGNCRIDDDERELWITNDESHAARTARTQGDGAMSTHAWAVTYRNVDDPDDAGRVGYYNSRPEAERAIRTNASMGVHYNLQLWQMAPRMQRVGEEFLCHSVPVTA